MRSPVSVCSAHQLPLALVQRAGLAQDRSGIAILPTSCSWAAADDHVEVLARRGRGGAPAATARSATLSRCAPSSGSRSCSVRSRTFDVWRSAEPVRVPFCAYMRRSTRRSAVVRLTAPRPAAARRRGAGDRERLAVLAQSARAAAASRSSAVARVERGEHAELVAAEPVGAAVRLRRPSASFAAETGEQGVARRMAEGVVVALEAVEVEEREQLLARSACRAPRRGRRISARRLPRPVSGSVSASDLRAAAAVRA